MRYKKNISLTLTWQPVIKIIWPHRYTTLLKKATSWENLFLPYANNKGADQPAHPRSLTSTFIVRCLDSIIPLLAIADISSLYLASVAAKAGLCLTWSQTLKTGFLVTRQIMTWSCRWKCLLRFLLKKIQHFRCRLSSSPTFFLVFQLFRPLSTMFLLFPRKILLLLFCP